MSPSDGGKPRKLVLSRETLAQTALSVALSALVALGVASYTANRADESQRREAARTRLTAVYLPLSNAVSAVVACVSPRLCSEGQLLRAGRDFNRNAVLTIGQGSEAVSDSVDGLQGPLRVLVENRLDGKQQPEALLRRAAQRSVDLQDLIARELLE